MLCTRGPIVQVLRLAVLTAALGVAFAGTATAQDRPAFAPAVNRVIDDVIQPGYAALEEAASRQAELMGALCSAPNAETLDAAHDGFSDLVAAWSRVEMFRFGPAREDNRFERLFFWPDRRGRGLRQVQALIAEEDGSALSPETLQDKSVAVQGLLALEYVLHGTGAETLLEDSGYRCRYGLAIAQAVESTASGITAHWTTADGFAAVMRTAGPENTFYKSHGEAVQDFLRAASEQLQIVRDLKLGAAVGETPGKAKPKRAPFWRSDLTLASIAVNLDAVDTLFADGGIDALLPANVVRWSEMRSFELAQAQRVIAQLGETGEPWTVLASETEPHGRLVYAQIPLESAIRVVSERYPGALGLILGFNSLDGD